MLLVVLLELAPRDAEICAVIAGILARFSFQDNAATLGARLLERAQLGSATIRDIS